VRCWISRRGIRAYYLHLQQHRLGCHRRRYTNALPMASANEHPQEDHDHAHVQRRPLRRRGINHEIAVLDQFRPLGEPHM
jgi:hypothetical protein